MDQRWLACLRYRHRNPVPCQQAFPSFPPDLEFRGVGKVAIRAASRSGIQPLSFQHPVQKLVSITRKLGCQLLHAFSKHLVVLTTRRMSSHRPVDLYESAGPPLTQHPEPDQVVPGSAACCGPYQCFDSSSFRAALSRCASASSCFSFRFSASSCFSFLASDTCIPPYLDRHRYKVCSEIPCFRQISASWPRPRTPSGFR